MSDPNTLQPAPQPIGYQPNAFNDVDLSHLNILTILYWIWGGLILLFSLIGLIYIGMGVAIVSGAFPQPATQPANAPMPNWFGWFFIGMGSAFLLIGQATGWLNIVAGFSLRKQKRRMLTMVTAGLNCISFPIGTTLGVFTFIVLSRPSVKARFASNEPIAPWR